MTSTTDQHDAGGTDPVVARHVRVSGRVQGVFFRASTRREARRHGLVGWVRNTADGEVEAHLQGAEEQVEAVLGWMRDGGPSAARVAEVDVSTTDVVGADGFDVRR